MVLPPGIIYLTDSALLQELIAVCVFLLFFGGGSDKTPYMFAALPPELLPACPQAMGFEPMTRLLIAVEVFVTGGLSAAFAAREVKG